ncbi:MAG: 4Fe-4S dicluster domain-containing protein [Armatimonadota bacterium]|nr:MAG: 4Fe-4S dicluster domain-containing protein [Armatimonadota bacterium]
MSKVIVVDANKCYACLGCVVECAYRRTGAGPHVPATSGVLSNAACEVIAVGTDSVPLVCNQCEDAPCLTVCPTEAIHRESERGPVVLAAERCIGCGACAAICPVGAIEMRWGEDEVEVAPFGNRVRLERCQECGAPIGALPFIERVRRELGPRSGHAAGLCSLCKQRYAAANAKRAARAKPMSFATASSLLRSAGVKSA